MAGIFYLPRLYVYHAEQAPPGSELSETFKVMERRLLRAIMNPAMIASWILGLLIIAGLGLDWLAQAAWMQVKLALVVAMTGFHMACARWRRDFEADANARSGRFYRAMNEAPTLLLIAIVIMAIVEPF
jgi:putative membrane protein